MSATDVKAIADNPDKRRQEALEHLKAQRAIAQKDPVNAKKLKIEKAEELVGSKAYSNAIYERGQSYIEAAKLILNNSQESTITQLGRSLQEQRGIKLAPNEIEIRLKQIDVIQQKWADWKEGKEVIENEKLAEDIQGLLQSLSDIVAPFTEGDPQYSLEHAENHCNWGKREPLKEAIEMGKDDKGNDIVQVRIDVPITRLTKEQERQWIRILEPIDRPDWIKEKDGKEREIPQWFKDLPAWERNLLRKRILKWKNENEGRKPEERENLGDYLGVPPTTVRNYPGARNSYKSYFYDYDINRDGKIGENTIDTSKIRGGHLAPDMIKSGGSKVKEKEDKKIEKQKKKKREKEILELAKENIKQLILAQVQELIDKGETKILVDVQTLITPTIISAGREDNFMDEVRLKAIKEIRKEFKDSGFVNFLKENGVKKDKTELSDNCGITCQLITTNHPVNKGRAFGFKSVASRIEHYKAEKILKKTCKEKVRLKRGNYDMAQKALNKMIAVSRFGRPTINFFATGVNHNAERAALEQIAVSALGGARLGSCMSGKDREGGVSEHVAGMTAYYKKYGEMPPIPPNIFGKAKKRRIEYERMVAESFLAGYEQRIANDNARGCPGIKSIDDVLGSNIVERIREILAERDPDNEEKWKKCPVDKLTNEIAKLNRVKKKVTESYHELNEVKPILDTPSSDREDVSRQLTYQQKALKQKSSKIEVKEESGLDKIISQSVEKINVKIELEKRQLDSLKTPLMTEDSRQSTHDLISIRNILDSKEEKENLIEAMDKIKSQVEIFDKKIRENFDVDPEACQRYKEFRKTLSDIHKDLKGNAEVKEIFKKAKKDIPELPEEPKSVKRRGLRGE